MIEPTLEEILKDKICGYCNQPLTVHLNGAGIESDDKFEMVKHTKAIMEATLQMLSAPKVREAVQSVIDTLGEVVTVGTPKGRTGGSPLRWPTEENNNPA